MNKLLIICGPTATGKTKLAIALAKKFSGEIVSADSRQVYKGMDIGTGKDLMLCETKRTCKPNGIPVWLLDVVFPNQEFSVADYVKKAWKIIEDIWSRGELPIMVGGTGFYIKAIVDGIATLGVPPNWQLRKNLSNLEIEKLQELLEKTLPERWRKMNESDRSNPRRLVRAIELAGEKNQYRSPLQPLKKRAQILMIGLATAKRKLYERIDKRVAERINQGLIEEIKKLLKAGYFWDNSVLGTTIGYREWQNYFNNNGTKEEAIKNWQFAEHGYARRQITWFKKDKRIKWFDINAKNWPKKLESLVRKWYNE